MQGNLMVIGWRLPWTEKIRSNFKLILNDYLNYCTLAGVNLIQGN